MRHKVCIIVPYFGKLPSTAQQWLDSCRHNTQIDWLLFTDDHTGHRYPQNVKAVYTSFGEIKERFEKKLGYPVALDSPYKLCDFRPLYGFLFEEELKGYTHWGYCDMDMLFGDIAAFITDEMLDTYDKIGVLGHLSIVKNTKDITHAFERCDIRSILTDPRPRIFDEVREEPNINSILQANGYRVLDTVPYADIAAINYNFRLYFYFGGKKTTPLKKPPMIFAWENGNAVGYCLENGKLAAESYCYVHFQKRKIEVRSHRVDRYLLVPNAIIDYPAGGAAEMAVYVKKYSRNRLGYAAIHRYIRIRNAIKRRIKR